MPNVINNSINPNMMNNQQKISQDQRDKSVSIQDIVDKKNDRLKGIKIVSTPNDVLDKNSFLKILLKQLEKQDPMKPQEDREFISQMAQFSSLEQMKNVADEVKSMKNLSSNNFIGKIISGKDFVSGKPVEGIVNHVVLDKSGQVFLRVNGKSVKMDDVTAVSLVEEKKSEGNSQLENSQNKTLDNLYNNSKDENVSRETSLVLKKSLSTSAMLNSVHNEFSKNLNSSGKEEKASAMKEILKQKLIAPSNFFAHYGEMK